MATVRHKHQENRSDEIVEKGDIFFAYRPGIEQSEPEGLGDVQRFVMVLKPQGGACFRLAVLGRKRLPEAEQHERIWGLIDQVAKSGGEIEAEFKEHHYDTKTRGERTVPSMRPAKARTLCSSGGGRGRGDFIRTGALMRTSGAPSHRFSCDRLFSRQTGALATPVRYSQSESIPVTKNPM